MISCAQFAERGDAPALLDDETGRWLDYRGLARAVAETVERLDGRPLVLLFFGLTIAGAVAYLACLEAGAPVGLFGAGLRPGLRCC